MRNNVIAAEKLLQAGAVQLNLNRPYTWASGWRSPIYCDNRKILSYPYIRDYTKSELCNIVFEKFGTADIIAGVATAGIPWGILVADQLKMPFIYVRPKPKEHGLANQIEGSFNKGQKVVVMEDLVSTGKSSMQVIHLLRDKGLLIEGMVSIFNYCFEETMHNLKKENITFFSLTDYLSLLQVAVSKGFINDEQQEILLKWRLDPANWTGVA